MSEFSASRSSSSTGLFGFARSRRFAPLFCTQFMGAFNDSMFKTMLFVMITYYGLGEMRVLPPAQLLNIGAFLFILPFFLFSSLSGQLCNRYDRARLARIVKICEIAIMLVAGIGFYYNSVFLLMVCLFAMGTHSTVFGPLKYVIIPDYLNRQELMAGNSLVEAGTFIAILLGQILGASLAGEQHLSMLAAVMAVAIMGYMSSRLMPSVPAKNPDLKLNYHIFRNTWELVREVRYQKKLFVAIVGISWFWCIGQVYVTQLPTFTHRQLGGNEQVFDWMITLFSVGIGIGSVICARISRHKLHLGLAIVGTLGMATFGITLALMVGGVSHHELVDLPEFLSHGFSWLVSMHFLLLGFFGGFFSLPLYTHLQTESSDEFRSHAIAANNIVNSLFMVLAALLSIVLVAVFNSVTWLFFAFAIGNLFVLLYFLKSSPEMVADFKALCKGKI